MKALVIAREGRRVILLLPGGEMRTVRARKDWQVGQEVPVTSRPVVFRRTRGRINWQAVVYPAMACAAAVALLVIGVQQLGGDYIDQVHSVQPMASGSVENTKEPTVQPTAEITSAPSPTPIPMMEPTAQTTPGPTPESATTGAAENANAIIVPTPVPAQETVRQTATSTPQPVAQRCDECGQTGHDDDACPNEKCDECGKAGHDDDACPNEKCDECGQTGHDDDDCPNDHDHDDDHDD